MKQKIGKNEITFFLNTKIYAPDIIYKACYVFIDRMYVHLDIPEKNVISANLKGKNNLNRKDLEKMQGEFLNELLNIKLREDISGSNKKILEYIVGGAINAALEKDESVMENQEGEQEFMNIEREIAMLKKELEEIGADSYVDDPLNIRQTSKINKKKKKK